MQRGPVVSGSLGALPTKPSVPGKQGAEASRVCSTQSCGRDIAAFDKIDALLSRRRAVLKFPPARRQRPGHQAPRWVPLVDEQFPHQRRPLQESFRRSAASRPRWARSRPAGPLGSPEGTPAPPQNGFCLPLARCSRFGSCAKLPSPCEKSESDGDCISSRLGLCPLRCSPQRQTQGKTARR